MSRKAFIQSHGATCRNWNWSWSFVNESKRFVIFGAWDKFNDGKRAMIFAEGWERYTNGHKSAGYAQSREHIRLVEEEGYELKTFPMLWTDEALDKDGEGPARIKGFKAELTDRRLIRDGDAWYAVSP